MAQSPIRMGQVAVGLETARLEVVACAVARQATAKTEGGLEAQVGVAGLVARVVSEEVLKVAAAKEASEKAAGSARCSCLSRRSIASRS